MRGRWSGIEKKIKKNIYTNIGQNTHHDKRDNTALHKERPKTTT